MNGILDKIKDGLIVPEIAEKIDSSAKPVGSLDFDAWGYNGNTSKLAMSVFRPIYEKFYRTETFGLENIPQQGRALIISNHSGQLPIDAMILGYALATNDISPRPPRAMFERFLPKVPFVGNLLNEVGGVVGDIVNCRKMLQADEVVMVFPEGVRGTGKTIDKRYQLQRFGHGFLHMAIECNAPIIPVGIVGCEESMPSIGNITPLANLTGLPYVPITTPMPLPTKVMIHIGEPMWFNEMPDTEMEIKEQVEQVKDAIRDLMREGLQKRKSIFR